MRVLQIKPDRPSPRPTPDTATDRSRSCRSSAPTSRRRPAAIRACAPTPRRRRCVEMQLPATREFAVDGRGERVPAAVLELGRPLGAGDASSVRDVRRRRAVVARSPPTTRLTVVSDPLLWMQGRHTIDVRARISRRAGHRRRHAGARVEAVASLHLPHGCRTPRQRRPVRRRGVGGVRLSADARARRSWRIRCIHSCARVSGQPDTTDATPTSVSSSTPWRRPAASTSPATRSSSTASDDHLAAARGAAVPASPSAAAPSARGSLGRPRRPACRRCSTAASCTCRRATKPATSATSAFHGRSTARRRRRAATARSPWPLLAATTARAAATGGALLPQSAKAGLGLALARRRRAWLRRHRHRRRRLPHARRRGARRRRYCSHNGLGKGDYEDPGDEISIGPLLRRRLRLNTLYVSAYATTPTAIWSSPRSPTRRQAGRLAKSSTASTRPVPPRSPPRAAVAPGRRAIPAPTSAGTPRSRCSSGGRPMIACAQGREQRRAQVRRCGYASVRRPAPSTSAPTPPASTSACTPRSPSTKAALPTIAYVASGMAVGATTLPPELRVAVAANGPSQGDSDWTISMVDSTQTISCAGRCGMVSPAPASCWRWSTAWPTSIRRSRPASPSMPRRAPPPAPRRRRASLGTCTRRAAGAERAVDLVEGIGLFVNARPRLRRTNLVLRVLRPRRGATSRWRPARPAPGRSRSSSTATIPTTATSASSPPSRARLRRQRARRLRRRRHQRSAALQARRRRLGADDARRRRRRHARRRPALGRRRCQLCALDAGGSPRVVYRDQNPRRSRGRDQQRAPGRYHGSSRPASPASASIPHQLLPAATLYMTEFVYDRAERLASAARHLPGQRSAPP